MQPSSLTTSNVFLAYKNALQYFRTGVLWLDKKGSVVGVNEQLALDLQYKKEELEDKTIFEIDPRMNILRWNSLWKALQEKPQHTTTEYITNDGYLIPVRIDSLFIKDGNEQLAFFIVENSMNAQRLKDLLEATASKAKVGGWEYDIVGDKITTTGYCQQILGLNDSLSIHGREDFLQRFAECISDDYLSLLSEQLEACLTKGRDIELELLVKNKEGEFIALEVSGSALQSELEQTIKIHGAIKDISAQTAKSEELYLTQFTVDHAKEMIFWIRSDGSFAYFNQFACQKLGYSRAEMGTMKAVDIAVEFSDSDLSRLWNKLREDQYLEYELQLNTKSGKPIPAYCSLNYIVYKENELCCIFMRDWTLKKEKEEELMDSQLQIESLSKRLLNENVMLKEEIKTTHNFSNIITRSPEYRKVLRQVAQVASSDATVLITGETGTGKELLARAIHSLSDRSDAIMIKVNCTTLPENLIESELFGHEKGAFTGAHQQKKGRFELASGGTIFLDEIGEMPLHLQPKLLRVLQEREFMRLGGNQVIKTDVRVIAATNKNLESVVEKGAFREDLFYRLNVFPIFNIPLRERREDIEVLIQFFAQKYGARMGKKIEKIPQADLDFLADYPFPGNVRELENIVERAVILTNTNVLNLKASFHRNTERDNASDLFLSFDEMQSQHIQKALQLTKGKVSGKNGAAELLGLHDKTLASKMRKLGIDRKGFVS
jgi:PAS domain S-box-containing protein